MSTPQFQIIPERWQCIGDVARRLAEKLTPAGECMVFNGTRSNQGYGSLRVDGRMLKAHRVAWELARGPVPDGLCVLHRCDNPPCCNVDHLFLGTVAINNADRAAKGRSQGVFRSGPNHPATKRRGEAHWQARLSAADVAAIRSAHKAGEAQSSIAKKYAVHPSTISRVARGVWRTEVSL